MEDSYSGGLYSFLQRAVGDTSSDNIDSGGSGDSVLEDLIHGKSKILGRKLDILASELFWRLRLAARNLKRIEQDRQQLDVMSQQLEQQFHYGLRDGDEKATLYRQQLDLQAEQRTQHVECWRDMANVMRDFLEVWEAHEQSRHRAQFLENVGPGTKRYL